MSEGVITKKEFDEALITIKRYYMQECNRHECVIFHINQIQPIIKMCEGEKLSEQQGNCNLPQVSDSLPFTEYHKFNKWIKDKGWYEACNGEYDNSEDPNSCIRLDIKELYIEYKRGNER